MNAKVFLPNGLGVDLGCETKDITPAKISIALSLLHLWRYYRRDS
ncbi:hypothetical protein [Helicobacter bilis]|nr:hypothetical protein [Helicobacter bilis]